MPSTSAERLPASRQTFAWFLLISANALWAASYVLQPNLILDAGFDHGLTSTSTQWQTFAGFTYVLPHRLWPHHEAQRTTR